MRFGLRTLFIITFSASVVVGIVILRYQYRAKMQAHFESFQRLKLKNELLKWTVKEKVLSIPDVQSALRANSETVPENFLSEGYASSSSGVGSPTRGSGEFWFDARHSYRWPNEKGRYEKKNEVDVSVAAQFDSASLEKHVVVLKYRESTYNREIASWIEQELTKHQEDIEVRHDTGPRQLDNP